MRRLPLLLLFACKGGDGPADTGGGETADTQPQETGPAPTQRTVVVTVTLDGAPAPDASLFQAGFPEPIALDAAGTATVTLDLTVDWDPYLIAAHPEARTTGDDAPDDEGGALLLELFRFDPDDNASYVFGDPGEPDRRDTTAQCGHCHFTINDDWYASPHRTSASNPAVQDLYAGAAAAFADEAACEAEGGVWATGIGPGTAAAAERCYLGDGVLPALNPSCDGAPCDTEATAYGACADCHAPGIDGALGGRDLLDATGFSYDYGVHCEVCHHVESVDPDGEAGVAGRLRLVRPSEPSTTPGLGEYLPLTFGPWPDVPNIRMGAVERELFHDGTLCMGCHQLDQEVLVPGQAADPLRWPDGRIPVHSTWREWEAGPFADEVGCPACHMPPIAELATGEDHGATDIDYGAAAGWPRPAGSIRHHSWVGPRAADGGLSELAAAVFVDEAVADGELVATVTVRNVGCGHALPTGEPLRSMVLLVEATCDGQALTPTGGDAISDVGGYLARKEAGEDWSIWPGAAPGDVIRVTTRPGTFHDYDGYGPFGDGTFDAAAKGLPVEHVAGEATVVDVAADGAVTLDRALPAGDVAYLGEGGALPADGDAATARAGAPGFTFARVLVGPDGERMVPHFLAVDVASDNRLLPQGESVTEHRFAATCEDPEVHAVLVHRAYPLPLARERGWTVTETMMDEVRR